MNFQKLKLNKHFFFSLFIAIGIGLFVSAIFVLAADWTAPPGTPPTCPDSNPACNTPLNVSSSTQYKAGALGVGGIFEAFNTSTAAIFDGEVGIGTATPERKLDIFDLTDLYNNVPLRISGPMYYGGSGTSAEYASVKLAFGQTGTTDAGYIKVTGNSWYTPGTHMIFGLRESDTRGTFREVLKLRGDNVNIRGTLSFTGGTGPFCIFSKACPRGWVDKGLGAYIYNSRGGATCPYTVGGEFNKTWTWCNVTICCNESAIDDW